MNTDVVPLPALLIMMLISVLFFKVSKSFVFCWMQIIFWLCNVYFCELDLTFLDNSLKQLIPVLVDPSLIFKLLKQGKDVVHYLPVNYVL